MEGQTLDWDVDYWYELLEPGVTFETEFLALNKDELRALAGADDSSSCLVGLAERINVSIGRLGGAAFVRLSSLSPKDAVRKNPQHLVSLVQTALQGCAEGDFVHELLAINRAQYLATKVTNGDEAMKLFCNSDRIKRHLQHRDSLARISVVVRRWVDIEPEMEFRGYVSGGKLVALSHYFKFLFTPAIVLNASKIMQSIVDFQESKIHIPLDKYVCDFYCNVKSFKVTCIELNPWAQNTSSALFSWDELNSLAASSPSCSTEFRYLKVPSSNAVSQQISPFWRALLAIARGHDGKSLKTTLPSVRQISAFIKLLKKSSQELQFLWPDSDLTIFLSEVEKRGYVTGSELAIILGNVMFSGGNFVAPTCLFLLWALSFKKKKQLKPAIWKCAEFLVQEQDIEIVVRNQLVWLKSFIKSNS